MKDIHIDIESFSSVDLTKCGVYKYAQSEDFEILLFGYSVDGGEVKVVDLAKGEKIPDEIINALSDDSIIKWAHNANFERVCLSEYLRKYYSHKFLSYSINEDTVGDYLGPSSWKCTMVCSAYMGLPFSLEDVGAVLGLDKQKLTEGKELIRYFCVPCKPTKANGNRTRNLPHHSPDKWEMFKKYNKRDVEVEMQIQQKLSKFPVPDFVWEEYHLDQEINDRGIAVDIELAKNAVMFDELVKAELMDTMQEITRLENPNSVQQMKEWLVENGLEVDSLDKKAVSELLKTAPPKLKKVLEIRQQLAKSSVKKYQAMLNAACEDNRARGMFKFYGANRTGRYSSRIIQIQNLPQNHMPDLEQAREIVRSGDYETMSILYDNIPDTLSQLIRTAFIPREGYKFIVADFSAIEARVIAWLAGEKWKSNAFAKGEDIYCSTASRMFNVPVKKHGINSELRQKGKVTELACIAEGQLVLTDCGLIPIEKVTHNMRLWDGEEWVCHEGVIFKGEREVITYEGLTATPEHLVWVEGKSKPIQFGIAAANGIHLLQTGNGGRAIRLGENNKPGKAMEQGNESLLCIDSMHRLWKHTMAKSKQFNKQKIKRLSKMFKTKANPSMVVQKAFCCQTKVRKLQRQRVSQLWSKRNKIRVFKRNRSRTLSYNPIWTSGQENGNRSNRQQWKLCSRQYPFCDARTKLFKQAVYCSFQIFSEILALFKICCFTKIDTGKNTRRNNTGCRDSSIEKKKRLEINIGSARLYDIRNAGRYHRFTVSGKLVHNCGYGGSVGALKSMGALEMGIPEDELKPLVDAWREANPNIVGLWYEVDRAVIKTVKERITTTVRCLKFTYKSGMLFITLPSGRNLVYVKPRIGENRFGSESVTYEGIGSTKKWERIESYGAKFVENCIQAIARDILFYAMKTLSHCFIVATVHDEIIIEADKRVSVDAVCEQMSRTPPWTEGLLLKADGFEVEFYKKE